MLDPSIHAYRPDIADIALAGLLFAPHYAAPLMRKSKEACQVLESKVKGAAATTRLATGEEFAVLDTSLGWSWGYRLADHRVGYVPEECLAPL